MRDGQGHPSFITIKHHAVVNSDTILSSHSIRVSHVEMKDTGVDAPINK